jgi:hypothetical protein
VYIRVWYEKNRIGNSCFIASITQTHSYAVVLGEVNGLRRLPIVIGGFEAQAIAVAFGKNAAQSPAYA